MNSWQKAAGILRKGGVIIIPSDSSYGIAALAENQKAVERVYRIKHREAGKPSLLIVGSIEQARELVEFTPLADDLAKKYWFTPPEPSGEGGPGGLTLVLDAKKLNLPKQIYGKGKTLAVRIPAKQQLRELTLEVGPIILPSANLAGLNPPYKAEEVGKELIESVEFFLDEPADGNPVSTLVDARGENPIILREGSVKL